MNAEKNNNNHNKMAIFLNKAIRMVRKIVRTPHKTDQLYINYKTDSMNATLISLKSLSDQS